jgi:hypothetical protein
LQQYLACLAQPYEDIRQPAVSLTTVTEMPGRVVTTEACWYEANIHRLKGELLRMQEGKTSKTKRWTPVSGKL